MNRGLSALRRVLAQLVATGRTAAYDRELREELDTHTRLAADDLNGPQRVDLTRRILDRVQTLPGVAAAGVTDALPLDRNRTWGIGIPGRTYKPGELPSIYVYVVSRGCFPAMDIASRQSDVPWCVG